VSDCTQRDLLVAAHYTLRNGVWLGSANLFLCRPDRDSRSVTPVKSMLEPPVQSLMQLIFNQEYMNEAMSALNYDAKKMPLGKLSKATINRGFQTLKDLVSCA
jgi:hypothetical protein